MHAIYATHEPLVQSDALAQRWQAMTAAAELQDLPYKVELNTWGKLEMTPASYRHGLLQGCLIAELARQMSSGAVLGEVPVLTSIGVRVPDAAWISNERMQLFRNASPLPSAPELCIEIVLPSNTDAEIQAKTRAYLTEGATEVWIVAEAGDIHYFDATGERSASVFKLEINLPSARE